MVFQSLIKQEHSLLPHSIHLFDWVKFDLFGIIYFFLFPFLTYREQPLNDLGKFFLSYMHFNNTQWLLRFSFKRNRGELDNHKKTTYIRWIWCLCCSLFTEGLVHITLAKYGECSNSRLFRIHRNAQRILSSHITIDIQKHNGAKFESTFSTLQLMWKYP